MFHRDLIEDASNFKYNKGDKLKLFEVIVEIVNMTYTSNHRNKNTEDKVYDVYIKNIDRFTLVSERMLNKYAKKVP